MSLYHRWVSGALPRGLHLYVCRRFSLNTLSEWLIIFRLKLNVVFQMLISFNINAMMELCWRSPRECIRLDHSISRMLNSNCWFDSNGVVPSMGLGSTKTPILVINWVICHHACLLFYSLAFPSFYRSIFTIDLFNLGVRVFTTAHRAWTNLHFVEGDGASW